MTASDGVPDRTGVANTAEGVLAFDLDDELDPAGMPRSTAIAA